MGKVDLNVIGKRTEPRIFEYTWRDVVLYALGVGATADELPLVYENAPVRQNHHEGIRRRRLDFQSGPF